MVEHISIRPPSNELTWSKDLELGLESMDKQHQQLVACVAELQIVSSAGSFQDVAQSMTRLYEVTVKHFDWEEQLMLTSGYSGYASHKEDHDHLEQQLAEVQREITEKRIVPSQTLGLFLERWTTLHVKFSDKPLAEFLKKRNIRDLK